MPFYHVWHFLDLCKQTPHPLQQIQLLLCSMCVVLPTDSLVPRLRGNEAMPTAGSHKGLY